jgi:hypothetical protein
MGELPRRFRLVRVASWFVLLMACCSPVPAAAAPDFSRTTITVSPDPPFEGEVATYTVVVRNTGPDDAGVVELRAEWPLMGFLVDLDGLDSPLLDYEGREIEARFPLAAGAERRFTVRVLAPREAAGTGLTFVVRLNHWDSSTEYWDRLSSTLDWRRAAGGSTLTPAAYGVLGVLTFGGVLLLVLLAGGRRGRARGGAFAAAFAVTLAVGFWTIFGAMAWRDYQSITAWRETRCTILGGRLSAQGTTSRSRTAGGTATRDNTVYVPVLGLRYEVDGRETFSSGYDTGSRVGIGGRSGREEELAAWGVGASVPCWYNPSNPHDIVVRTGFGGAYFFALLPLPVFLFGVWQAGRMLRR